MRESVHVAHTLRVYVQRGREGEGGREREPENAHTPQLVALLLPPESMRERERRERASERERERRDRASEGERESERASERASEGESERESEQNRRGGGNVRLLFLQDGER
jgi:hypothetical protein